MPSCKNMRNLKPISKVNTRNTKIKLSFKVNKSFLILLMLINWSKKRMNLRRKFRNKQHRLSKICGSWLFKLSCVRWLPKKQKKNLSKLTETKIWNMMKDLQSLHLSNILILRDFPTSSLSFLNLKHKPRTKVHKFPPPLTKTKSNLLSKNLSFHRNNSKNKKQISKIPFFKSKKRFLLSKLKFTKRMS